MVNIIGRAVPVQPQEGMGSIFETLAKPFMDTLSGDVKRSSIGLNTAKTSEIQQALQAGAALADLARNGQINTREADAQGILAGKPSTFGGGYALNDTLRSGAPLQGDAVARGQVMRGDSYNSTGLAFGQNQANELEKQKMQEATRIRLKNMDVQPAIGPDGSVVFTTAGAATAPNSGFRPLTSVDQERARTIPGALAGASPERVTDFALGAPTQKTPRTYAVNGQSFVTYDGVTNAQTGGPLPQGGAIVSPQGSAGDVGLRPNVQGNLQSANIANDKFRSTLAMTRDAALASPNNFGIPGMIKGATQDVSQLAGTIAGSLGYPDIQQAVSDLQSKIIQNPNIDPSLFSGAFDPSLPALHSLSDLLVYSAAESLAGQSGRSMTDGDVKRFRLIVGDPRDLFSSQQKFLSKLDLMEKVLNAGQGVIDKNLRPGQPPAAQPSVAAPPAPAQPAPAPAAPAPAPAAPTAEQVPTATGPGGQKLYLRNGQWSPQ